MDVFIILLIIIAVLIVVGVIVAVVLGTVLGSKNEATTTKTEPHYHTITELKGMFGEHIVERVLGGNIDDEKYVINGYIFENNGKSTEIDHIVVNTYGVFVIETKNRAGDIYGNDELEAWTQVLGNGDTVHTFHNPVKQNASHANKIKSILGTGIPIHSLVVFVKNNTDNINSNVVIPLTKLNQAINSGKPVLNPKQIKVVYESLLRHRSTISHDEHARRIKEQNYNIFHKHICPLCGSNLIFHEDSNDKYLYCSNQKCKFTKNIK